MSGGTLDTLDILTMAEAAALTGVQPQAMKKAAQRGRLRARKVGPFWITTRQAVSVYTATVAEIKRSRRLGIRPRHEEARAAVVDLPDGRLTVD